MYVSALNDEIEEGFKVEATPKGFAFKVTKEGGVKMTTPTGTEVVLDPTEEHEIAKQALKDSLKMKMTAVERRVDTTINSALNAAGYAIGLGLAGLSVGLFLSWVGGKKGKLRVHAPFTAR